MVRTGADSVPATQGHDRTPESVPPPSSGSVSAPGTVPVFASGSVPAPSPESARATQVGWRPVRDADSAALIALIGECWAEYPGCVLDVDGEEPWLRAPGAAYAAADRDLWVVERDGQVIACAGLVMHGRTAELKSLYVARAGRRQGLGGRLVAAVEAEAARRGATAVELWSDTRFADAHRLYQRLGYHRTGRQRELHDLSATTEYEFAKQLAATG